MLAQKPRKKVNKPPYEPKEWETVPCPMCNSEDFSFYEKIGDKLQYTYVLCNNCQLVYQSPRPVYNDDFVNAAYGEYYAYDPEYSFESYEKTSDYKAWDDSVREIIEFDSVRSAILDVGACMGEFLYPAKKYYPAVYGMDVASNMANFIEKHVGVETFVSQFEQFNTDLKFSCIHMSHVIEHIPVPNEWLQKAKGLLCQDGILVICVPHMFSLDRKFKLFMKKIGLRKGTWKHAWKTPDHLFEPTIPAMLRFFEANGYDVLKYYTYSRKDMVSKSLWNRIYQRTFRLGSNLRFYVRPKTYAS